MNEVASTLAMRQKAVLAVIAAAIIAGFSGIFIKYMDSLNATSIAWIRSIVPTVLVGAWLLFNKVPIFRGNYKIMLGASTLNAARMYLFFVAYIFTSIGNAVILFYIWPIFVTIFSYLFLKERISRRQTILLLIAFAGLIIAYADQRFSFEDRDFIGMLAAVGSASIYASTVVIFKSQAARYKSYEMVFFQNLIGALIFLPFFIIHLPSAQVFDIGLGILYASLIGIVGFGLFFYSLSRLKASTASTLMYGEVVSAIILSYLWMGDQLSLNMMIGGSLILISSYFTSREK